MTIGLSMLWSSIWRIRLCGVNFALCAVVEGAMRFPYRMGSVEVEWNRSPGQETCGWRGGSWIKGDRT